MNVELRAKKKKKKEHVIGENSEEFDEDDTFKNKSSPPKILMSKDSHNTSTRMEAALLMYEKSKGKKDSWTKKQIAEAHDVDISYFTKLTNGKRKLENVGISNRPKLIRKEEEELIATTVGVLEVNGHAVTNETLPKLLTEYAFEAGRIASTSSGVSSCTAERLKKKHKSV